MEGSKGRILPNHMPVMSSHWNREGGLPKHTSPFCFLLPGSLPHCPLSLYLKTTTTKRRFTSWPGSTFLLVTNTSNAQHPSPSPRCCSSLLEKPPTAGLSVAQLSEPPQALRYTSSALPYGCSLSAVLPPHPGPFLLAREIVLGRRWP